MLTFIPDIAAEHFEELQFLWSQRRRALHSAAYTMREIGMLEERIEAHVQGLLVLGDRILDVVGEALLCDDELAAFAAAFVLLRSGTPGAIERVSAAFLGAEGKRLEGIRDALAHGPAQPLIPLLQSLVTTGAPPLAVAAGEALAFHRALRITAEQLIPLLRDESPAVRRGAWRIVTYGAVPVASPLYDGALLDDDPDVQSAALTAAAWNGYAGWLAHCRKLAAAPSPDGVHPIAMLAAVLPPQEYQAVSVLASMAAFGPERYRIAAAFGHPVIVEYLLEQMASADPAAAAGASAAFSKMLGVTVDSNRRATLAPSDGHEPDDFEAEFLEEVRLPDVQRAQRCWDERRATLVHATRIASGVDVSAGITRDTFGLLDMQSRREVCLRARLTAGWSGTPVVLEQFPLRA